ncbi:hypothetical protein [Geofilum rubicundum]|nr:hypothetical protein [Geofilum rubicundum]
MELKHTFIEDLKDSREITLNEWPLRPKIQKIKESFARLVSPLL